MSNYLRLYQKGGIYFFTVVTYQRKPFLCEPKAITRLKAAFHYTKQKRPFHIHGLVVLPDHLHCIWQLPENDNDFSTRWRMLKQYFSMGIKSNTNQRGEKNVWQKRFWEHLIRDEKDFQRCLDYIHYNPVKHGYVAKPCDWRYSTFIQNVKKGIYEMNWGCNVEPDNIQNIKLEQRMVGGCKFYKCAKKM